MHQRTGTRLTHVCYHRLNGTNNISPKPKSEAQITVVICNSHVYDSTAVRRCSAVTLTSATLTEPRLNTQKLCSGCNVHGPHGGLRPTRSYPIGQRPQSAGGQDVAEEGDRTAAPGGGATHAATERVQTAAEGQTRYLEPDYHNEMSGERGRRKRNQKMRSKK